MYKNMAKKYILLNNDVDTSFSTLEMTWYGMRDKRIKDHVGMLLPHSFFELVKGKSINYYSLAVESKLFIEKCTKAVLINQKMLFEDKTKTRQITKEMQEFAKNIFPKIETLSNAKIIATLKETKRLQAECVVYGTAVGFADVFGGVTNKLIAVVEKRKKLKHSIQVYTSVLGMPEERSFTEAAIEEIRTARKTTKQLAEEYFWLHQGYIGRGIIEEEIEKIRKTNAAKKEEYNKKELYEELCLDEEEKKLFQISQDVILIKALRADMRQCLCVIVNKIIDYYAKRWNIEAKYLETLSVEELCECIAGKEIPNSLENRWNHGIYIQENKEYKVITGDEAEKFLKNNVLEEKTENNNVIKGQVAQPGNVKGRVKLVFGPQHNNKVKEGDILVAPATSPQFLPAMERAAAFITDVGGITSHAAIVARELKKPCIVGTKSATRMFKDGDLVEVDATKGIIKRIK